MLHSFFFSVYISISATVISASWEMLFCAEILSWKHRGGLETETVWNGLFLLTIKCQCGLFVLVLFSVLLFIMQTPYSALHSISTNSRLSYSTLPPPSGRRSSWLPILKPCCDISIFLSDPSGHSVCDQCKPEYQGPNCDQCRDGFYNAVSICLPCNCSGNADPGTSLPHL